MWGKKCTRCRGVTKFTFKLVYPRIKKLRYTLIRELCGPRTGLDVAAVMEPRSSICPGLCTGYTVQDKEHNLVAVYGLYIGNNDFIFVLNKVETIYLI